MLTCNIQNEMHQCRPIQLYSGAKVTHTNRCRTVQTLRHYNLVPKCPGAEVSREHYNDGFEFVKSYVPVQNTIVLFNGQDI